MSKLLIKVLLYPLGLTKEDSANGHFFYQLEFKVKVVSDTQTARRFISAIIYVRTNT